MPSNAPTLYDKVDQWIVRIIRWVSYVSAVFLLAIMLIAFFNVIGEKLKVQFGILGGIPMSMALIQYFHIPVVFLAAGFVTLDRGHTRIDMLSQHFPQWLENAFSCVGHLLGTGLCMLISYRAVFVIMLDDIAKNKTITTSYPNAWPEWPFALIQGVGFFVMGISFLWAFVRQIHNWNAPRSSDQAKVQELEQELNEGGDKE